MTADRTYSRAYSKGHYAGAKSRQPEIDRLREEHASAMERAQSVEAKRGIGHCAGCRFWQQETSRASWGHCQPDTRPGGDAPWMAPSSGDEGGLVTRKNFGCVLFRPIPEGGAS